MLCEDSGKDGESEVCKGCGNRALTGALEKDVHEGREPHCICNLISLKEM
jgi:hypothetical protein